MASGPAQQAGAAPTYTVLYSFPGGPTDGDEPFAGLVRDPIGNLYGTTKFGGTSSNCPPFPPLGCGTIFKLSPTGTETVLHSFAGYPTDPNDGAFPTDSLIRDAEGNLYGTTEGGGAFGGGVVFKLSAKGTETVLHSFGAGTDGIDPFAGLIRDPMGNLYGTTFSGGRGCGTVFKVDSTGKESVLHGFASTDGCAPTAALIRDAEGNLYGTTPFGGASGNGVVFKLSPNGAETVLYNFAGAPTDGAFPQARLMRDPLGNFYATTFAGGSADFCFPFSGCGTIFKLTPNGTETVLHSFGTGIDGTQPFAGLVRDPADNLYGTTLSGGATGTGVVFKLSPTGTETVLHSFGAGTDGSVADGGLARDALGNLYGTTQLGGTHGGGVVFKLSPSCW